jgi:hypothetical protein
MVLRIFIYTKHRLNRLPHEYINTWLPLATLSVHALKLLPSHDPFRKWHFIIMTAAQCTARGCLIAYGISTLYLRCSHQGLRKCVWRVCDGCYLVCFPCSSTSTPKLHNINLHNVTRSLTSRNPREQIFVAQISPLIVTLFSLILQFFCQGFWKCGRYAGIIWFVFHVLQLLHPKLRNTDPHNVTHSLTSWNPRESMFVVQISLLVVSFLFLI